MARAALGLLRVCQRMLPYKEDTADALLKSLQLLLRLSPAAAWDLAQPIAAEVSQPASTAGADTIGSPHSQCLETPLTHMHPASARLYASLEKSGPGRFQMVIAVSHMGETGGCSTCEWLALGCRCSRLLRVALASSAPCTAGRRSVR